MKNVLFLVLLLSSCCWMHAQNANAITIAGNIAKKMKDSLGLTEQQKNQIYDINLQLNDQKTQVRQQYGNTDSLRIKLQKVERSRDSLYRAVLPEDKYLLYREKKRNLISSN